MNESDPKMSRREFITNCGAKLPGLMFIVAGCGLTSALADEPHAYNPEAHSYAMGIDVHKCIGCGRCAAACKAENKVPVESKFFRTWVERYVIPVAGETQVDSPNGGIDGFPDLPEDTKALRTFFVPKLCNHCSQAPCVQVCPVGATFVNRDGVVLVDESYCVGCRYCIQACPYGARYLHPEKKVADKCTFCYHRITKSLLPACVEVCPTQARVFGELDSATSPLRRFLRFNDITTLKPWLNTDPRVFYGGSDGEVI